MTTEIRKLHNDPVQSADLQHQEVKDKFNTHTALAVNPASTNTNTEKHLSDAQAKVWQDHVGITSGNPHGTAHSQLSSIEQADDTSGNTDGGKHVTSALVKKYNDHAADTAIHHTLEAIQDSIAGMLVEGGAVTLTYDDEAGTLTISVPSAAASADASGTAGAVYTFAEQAIINGLVSSLNDLKGKMRTAGLLTT
jgi:hypothetical protein